jgi:hypothetical protein
VPALAGRRPRAVRFVAAVARRVPALTRIPAQLIAFGPLPEHAPPFARRPAPVSR